MGTLKSSLCDQRWVLSEKKKLKCLKEGQFVRDLRKRETKAKEGQKKRTDQM